MFFQPEEMIKAIANPQANTTPTPSMSVNPTVKQLEQQQQHHKPYSSNVGSRNNAISSKNPNNETKNKSSLKNLKSLTNTTTQNNNNPNQLYKYLPEKGYYINLTTNFKCSYQC